jgi:cyclohexanone monooxygenase
LSHEANAAAADFVRAKIRDIVHDPALAAKLTPKNIIGAKRLCVDSGYYATFNRPNVTLVDLADSPPVEITPQGVRAQGRTFPVDAIVYATGFDAMTGALLRIEIRGRGGIPLRDLWAQGPRSYLGLQIAGFPNLFTITGPGSPSVLTNMLPSIEQHVNWIASCLDHLRARNATRIEASGPAQNDWMAHVQEAANASIKGTTGSWYLGANIAGKPRVFMPYLGGVPAYLKKCDEVVANGYEGFVLS